MKIFITLFLMNLTIFGQNAFEPVIPASEASIYREISGLVKDKPEEALKKISLLDKSRSAAFDYLAGVLLHQKNEIVAAEEAFLIALKKFPQFYRVHQSLSIIYLNKNDSKKALKHLFEIVKSGRADGQIWKSVASCYINNGSLDAAEKALENARVFAPDDSTLDDIFLNIYVRQEDNSKVLTLARELSEKFPKEKKYLLMMISALQSQGKSKEALKHFLLYERLFEMENTQMMQLAIMLFNEQLYNQAVDRFSKVRGELQNDAILKKAICFSQIDEHDKVIDTLSTKFVNASPQENENFYLLRGNAFLAKDDLHAAEKEYLEALSYNSLNAQVNFNLAQIHETNKDYEKALDRYQKAANNELYAASSYIRKATIYFYQKEYRLALSEAGKARDIDASPAIESFYNQLVKLSGK